MSEQVLCTRSRDRMKGRSTTANAGQAVACCHGGSRAAAVQGYHRAVAAVAIVQQWPVAAGSSNEESKAMLSNSSM